MPPTPDSFHELLDDLKHRALDFIPQTRREQTARRWVTPSLASSFETDEQYQAFLLDIEDYIDDFLLSHPSASGSTAFDRMARGFKGSVQEARAVHALRDARFHLFRLEAWVDRAIAECIDCTTQDRLRLFAPDLGGQHAGLHFFSRLARDNTGLYFNAGLMLQLDEATLSLATNPDRPAGFSRDKESRWVEAIYMHIVRDVTVGDATADHDGESADASPPGSWLVAATEHMRGFMEDWQKLGSAKPDAGLIARTRQAADPDTIILALSAALFTDEQPEVAHSFERVAFVLMETMHYRDIMFLDRNENIPILDGIAELIEVQIGDSDTAARLLGLFRKLRRRIPRGPTWRDDAADVRLAQHIDGLRDTAPDGVVTRQVVFDAAETVARLLDAHGATLTADEVTLRSCAGVILPTERRRETPLDQCGADVAEFFDCRHWEQMPEDGNLRHVFLGLRADVAAAEYIYRLVERAFHDELADFRTGDIYGQLEGYRHAATKAFQSGLLDGIHARLGEMRRAREPRMVDRAGRSIIQAKSNAVSAALALLGVDLKARPGGTRNVLTEAYAAGKDSGN